MSRIILLNKPYHVLCQFRDENGRKTLADFISQPAFYPAGRLDYDSEGLVVLTDDGQLQHRISHPKQKLRKRYWVQVEGEPVESDLDPLRHGVKLNDGMSLPATVKTIASPDLWSRQTPVRFRRSRPTSWLQIDLQEGRNRQVRRMTAAIGFPTLRLVRVRIGDWEIDGLAPGEYREIWIRSPASSSREKHSQLKPRRVNSRRRHQPL